MCASPGAAPRTLLARPAGYTGPHRGRAAHAGLALPAAATTAICPRAPGAITTAPGGSPVGWGECRAAGGKAITPVRAGLRPARVVRDAPPGR